MDKMREEFEAWFEADSMPLESNWFKKDDDDDYDHMPTYYAWRAWQASRAALCIELPKTPSFSASDEPDLAFEEGVDVMKDLIEAAGVTCK